MLLALLIATVAVAAAAPAAYVRPDNLDCLATNVSSGGLTSSANLFPAQFYLQGDSVKNSSENVQVTVAQNFQVLYYPQYKVVINTYVNETYILYQCGAPAPLKSAFPASTKIFEIPLTAVSVTDTVPFAFIEILGVTARVQSLSAYTFAPCGQKLLSCNKTAVDSTLLSNETLLATTVDPYVDGITVSYVNPDPKAFVFSASQDPGTLNRAEWVKFLGLFFNMEAAASTYFTGVEQQYNALKRAASTAAFKPVVAWVTFYNYSGDLAFQIDFTAYKADYVKDAGGQMLDMSAIAKIPGVRVASFSPTILEFSWGSSTGFASREAAQAAFDKVVSKVDVFIDETYIVDPTSYHLKDFLLQYGFPTNASQQATYPFLANNTVYREDGLLSPTLGLDWYEGAIAHPERVLADLVRVVHPELSKATTFIWFRNVEENPKVVGEAACTSNIGCNAAPLPICPLVKVCPDGSVVSRQDVNSCTYPACPSGTNAAAAVTASLKLLFSFAAGCTLLLLGVINSF